MTPTFNSLPALPCPEWLPKPLLAEWKTLTKSAQAIETKRTEVLDALNKARNQDLAVYTPVAYDARPMLQAELRHRREVDAFLRKVVGASSAYGDECHSEIETARDEVRKRLLDMGYEEPIDGVPMMGAYTLDAVARHPHVRCAIEKHSSVKAAGDLSAHIHENLEHVNALTATLTNMRESVLS